MLLVGGGFLAGVAGPFLFKVEPGHGIGGRGSRVEGRGSRGRTWRAGQNQVQE